MGQHKSYVQVMPFPSSVLLNYIKNLLLLSLILFFFSCSSSRYPGKKSEGFIPSPAVRILLNEPSQKLELKIEDDIYVFAGEKNICLNRKGDILSFEENKGLVLISGRTRYTTDYFTLKPVNNFTIYNKKLTGDLRVMSDGKHVYLVNPIPIEDYLKGVLPAEMPLGRGDEYFEALKAFAICARTYTLQRLSAAGGLFDVRTDVRDQVYGGLDRRQPISDKAVDETEGMILTYDGKPALVFYSSTCGGRTEDNENVFGSTKYPYLQSVEDGDDPYCSVSPRFKWEESFTEERIVSLLKNAGKIEDSEYKIASLNINSRFRSGKINELEIILDKNGRSISVKIYGNRIRSVFLRSGNQLLFSNNFEIIKDKNNYLLRGKGSGHGVGLCQWGALNQSTRGIKSEDILQHYFPGTEIMRHYD